MEVAEVDIVPEGSCLIALTRTAPLRTHYACKDRWEIRKLLICLPCLSSDTFLASSKLHLPNLQQGFLFVGRPPHPRQNFGKEVGIEHFFLSMSMFMLTWQQINFIGVRTSASLAAAYKQSLNVWQKWNSKKPQTNKQTTMQVFMSLPKFKPNSQSVREGCYPKCHSIK